MADLLTIRMQDTDKKALALSSHLSDLPVSRLIMPYIAEGTRTVLGSVILYHIDRSGPYDRRALEMFTNIMIGSFANGPEVMFSGDPEELKRSSPKIVWDFFDIMSEAGVLKRMNDMMEDVRVRMNPSYVTSAFLRYLCYRIGDEYMKRGGSLEKFDYHQASEIFFRVMLERFYHHNAEGTYEALQSQYFMHQGLFRELAAELMDRYSEKTRETKLEAIEVQAVSREMVGRSGRKRRREKGKRPSRVVAKEL